MHRSISAAALLAATMFLGCGQQPANPPAPPDSAAGNPATDLVEPSDEQLDQQSKALTSENQLTEEMPVEEKADMTDESARDEKPVARTALPEETADNVIAENDAKPAASKSKGSSGKLLRSLGNSFTRALSKAVTAAGGDARPAPKLEDDPFPKGEPNQ